MKRGQTNLNFLISINKPIGLTSHDIVNRIRKITGEGRVGHMGTLDPMASGVMLIGVGSAARLNNYLENCDKTYVAQITFGKSTNTYDAEGEVVKRADVPKNISDENFVKQYVNNLVGVHKQVPPAFSAIKIDGKPAYKAARKGDALQLPKREIEIYSANLISANEDKWNVELEVSKGTYIRSIANDIGEDLGCGAHLSALQRTKIGEIDIDDCYSLENFQKAFENDTYRVQNAAEMTGLPCINADEKMLKRIEHGNSLRYNCR